MEPESSFPHSQQHPTCPSPEGKGKVHPRTGHEGPEMEYRYNSTLSLTSALDGVGGQRHAPAALPSGKTRYPLYRRLGGPQGRSGRVRKIWPPTRIRSLDRPARIESLYRLSSPAHAPLLTLTNLRPLVPFVETTAVIGPLPIFLRQVFVSDPKTSVWARF